MADFTADAKQFTMDGGIVYDFKDEDDYKTAKKDLSHLKKAMASNWVEQPRQRKVRINYNEADFLKGTHLVACCLISAVWPGRVCSTSRCWPEAARGQGGMCS